MKGVIAESRVVTDRNAYFDFLKGVGTILVVIGHVNRGLSVAGIYADSQLFRIADTAIYSFHMPIFFLVSGYLLSQSLARHRPERVMYARARTLILPFIVWNAIAGLLLVAASGYTNQHFTWHDFSRSFIIPNGHFWFFFALFFISAVMIGASYFANVFIGLVFLIAVLLGLATPYSPISELGVSAYCVAAGILIHRIVQSGFADPLIYAGSALWGVVGLVGIVQADWKNPLLGLILALPGIALVTAAFHVANVAGGLRWILFVGGLSLEIFVLHVPLAAGTRIVLMHAFAIHDPIVHLVLGAGIGVLGSILISTVWPAKLKFAFGR